MAHTAVIKSVLNRRGLPEFDFLAGRALVQVEWAFILRCGSGRKLLKMARLSVPLDEPIGAVVAPDEDISEGIRRDCIRSGGGAAILEDIHRRPGAGAGATLAKNPFAGARPSDEQDSIRVAGNAADLPGTVRDELIIVLSRPRIAAVGALAHDPVGGGNALAD